MIETLRIRNVALVEEAVLELGPGLNAVTGETGAGKSLVLGALALLAGGRAPASAVRRGADAAVVEAVLRTERLPELEAELAARGIPVEDHELVVRRTLAAGGRSRAQVAGQLVPVSVLAELFAGRIEISSQHESQRLRRRELHGLLLDRVGGLLPLREAVARGHASLREADAELERLRAASAERERRRDFLAFQVGEIDAARLDPEEGAALRAERARLAHAGRLREEGAAALTLLCGDPSGGEASGASDRLGEAGRLLAGLARLDPGLAGLAERVAGAQEEVRELALELERYAASVEADPGRLGALEERLHEIESLQRKYGPEIGDVLRFREEAGRELAGIEGADEREAAIRRDREPTAARLESDAARLSRGRARAARTLSRAVQEQLHALALPGAEFAALLEPLAAPDGTDGPLPCGPGGREQVEFAFTANAGEPLRPLRQVASGGELSRVFLALLGAAREAEVGMVLVFDEVDAGIGGAVADRIGRALADLSRHHQVLCISHLPQIAALADTHFAVTKSAAGGRSAARVTALSDEARVEEIARMAGGAVVSDATRRHARELVGSRRPGRRPGSRGRRRPPQPTP